MKIYEIKRTVIEIYEISAESKEKAKQLIIDPHTITVVKETIKIKS